MEGGAAPWPQWEQTMGIAKMPTQFGDDPKYVTLSGGWADSITARSQHKKEAFDVLKVAYSKEMLASYDVAAAQITPRKDIVDVPEYKNVPLSSFFTELVGFTQFRPGFPAYPKLSVEIDRAMQQVMQGQSSADAMKAYQQAATNIAGADNVETK
jgi:multiple sugar transport system substrate-binding protein